MSGGSIGSVAGFFIGNAILPGLGGHLGTILGGAIGSALDPLKIKGPSIGDAAQQTSQAGVPRPIVFGHPAPFAGNHIDGERKARKIVTKKKQGKGGGPVTTTESFRLTYAIRIGEPIAGVVRLWRQGKCVYDIRALEDMPGWDGAGAAEVAKYYSEMQAANQKWLAKCRFYYGGEAQMPDPALEAIHGVGNTPYYRGSSLFVVEDDDVTDVGGACPGFQIEAIGSGIITLYTGATFMDNNTAWFSFDGHDEETNNPAIEFGNFYGGAAGTSYPTGKKAEEVRFSQPSLVVGAFPGYSYGKAIGFAEWVNLDGSLTTQETFGFYRNETPAYYRPHFLAIKAEATGSGTVALTLKFFDASAVPQAYVTTTAYNVASGRHFVGIDYDPVTHTAHMMVDGSIVRSLTAIAHPLDLGWWASQETVTSGGGTAFNSLNLVKHDELAVFVHNTDTGLASGGFGFLWNNGNGRNYTEAISGGFTGPTSIPGAPQSYFDPETGEVVTVAGQTAAETSITLASVEEAIALRCGVPLDKFDVSALAGITIPGYLIARQATGADCLRPLCQAFFHDLPEPDGIVAVLRGGAASATITDADLIGEADEKTTQAPGLEYPLKVSVVTQHPEADYAAIPQTSERYSPDVIATGEVTLNIPIPFSATEALRIAVKIHNILWAQAEASEELVLCEKHSALIGSDVIIRNNRRWLIVEGERSQGQNKIRTVYDRASSYESSVTGQVPAPPTPPGSGVEGPTLFAAVNLPRVRSQDMSTGMWIGMAGMMETWPGGSVLLSVDGGLTYGLVHTQTEPTIMGAITADVLAAATLIPVLAYGDELENKTADQILAGGNYSVIRTGTTPEVFAYETATETTPGRYDLEDLTRGIDTLAADHFVGDLFMDLSTATFLPIDAAYAGQTLFFKAVPNGVAVEAVEAVEVVFDPGELIIDGGGDPL